MRDGIYVTTSGVAEYMAGDWYFFGDEDGKGADRYAERIRPLAGPFSAEQIAAIPPLVESARHMLSFFVPVKLGEYQGMEIMGQTHMYPGPMVIEALKPFEEKP